MKRIDIVLFWIVFTSMKISIAHAQAITDSLPISTAITPYRLDVGFFNTTVLIFPAPVKSGDRGFNDIIAEKEKDVANVLKVKAVKKNFQPTNLHIFTADGKVYVFQVNYTDFPVRATFDLSQLKKQDSLHSFETVVQFSDRTFNDIQLDNLVNMVKAAKPFYTKRSRTKKMKLQLRTIYTSKDILFFGFIVSNNSKMNYNLDFIRLFIRDKQKAKRVSIDEKEIIPTFQDTVRHVDGESKCLYIIAVPKFTIADGKQFRIEMYERNGGRNIIMNIKNRHLLRAKALLQ